MVHSKSRSQLQKDSPIDLKINEKEQKVKRKEKKRRKSTIKKYGSIIDTRSIAQKCAMNRQGIQEKAIHSHIK